MLEQLLGDSDLSKGVTLLINSPGGNILAAERMIKTLQSYSGTKKYNSIIPKMAMSAAAMVCLGSDKLIMSPTSSLGPIDPQIQEYNHKTEQWERYSVFYILKSYKILFEKSANLSKKQNLEPYLQALDHYDPKKIEEYKSDMELSRDIAVNALKAGMFKTLETDEIKEKIKIFLTPEKTKTHDRCIYASEAMDCGLNIEMHDVKDNLWKLVSEVNLRIEHSLPGIANIIETKDKSFYRGLAEEDDLDEE